MKNTAMIRDIDGALYETIEGYPKKLLHTSFKIEILERRLDTILDKPFDEGVPDYSCGDALNEARKVLDDAAEQMVHIAHFSLAKVASWGYFPDFEDEEQRSAFVSGYMEATK